MFLIVVALVAVLVATIYTFLTWNFNYWKKRGIPYEDPMFFFGNFKEAFTGQKHFGLVYCDLYKKFENAAYFGFFKLGTPTLVLRDLDTVKDVLVKEFNSFSDNDFHIDLEQDKMLAANPFARNGEDWKVLRAQWSSGMTMNRVKLMYGTLSDKCDVMIKYLDNHVAERPGESLEAKELALKFLTDVIVCSVLGLNINTFEDDQNDFKKIATSLFASGFWDNLKNMTYMIAPWLHKYFKIGLVNKAVEKKLMEFAENVIEVRKQHGFLKNDFFENLMKQSKDSKVDVAGRVFGFLSEGIESSSGLISFTLFELASNPHIQIRLREELERTAATTSDGKLTFEHIHSMPYLEMVIQEVLRLHPPVFTLNKVCTKAFTLGPAVPGAEPFEVPVGMPVTVPYYALQVDPQYFPDPQHFNPERFTPEAKANIPKFAFLPFSEGPRNCVGMRLGLTNSKACLSTIIRNFEVRVDPRTKPKPLPVDPAAFINRPVGDLWLTFNKISK